MEKITAFSTATHAASLFALVITLAPALLAFFAVASA